MPVQTRNQTRQQQIYEQQLGSTDEPVIMSTDEPASGKPPCYLTWGRFLTEKEYHSSGGKTTGEVTKMMGTQSAANGPRGKRAVYPTVKELGDVDPMADAAAAFALGIVEQGQTENQDECAHCPQETTHGLAWSANVHYMSIGGQCGQSCGCCRADVYKSGMDEDAKWGACSICLSS